MGWVQRAEIKAALCLSILRDRSGILQIIFEENKCGTEIFEKASKLRSEFVIAVTGQVCERAGAVNREPCDR